MGNNYIQTACLVSEYFLFSCLSVNEGFYFIFFIFSVPRSPSCQGLELRTQSPDDSFIIEPTLESFSVHKSFCLNFPCNFWGRTFYFKPNFTFVTLRKSFMFFVFFYLLHPSDSIPFLLPYLQGNFHFRRNIGICAKLLCPNVNSVAMLIKL